MSAPKRLLIVHHTPRVANSGRLAAAVLEAHCACLDRDAVAARLRCRHRRPLACDGLLLGTPETSGHMSGALKDFFDRTYSPLREGKTRRPALQRRLRQRGQRRHRSRRIGRIAKGYGWKTVDRGPDRAARDHPCPTWSAPATRRGDGDRPGDGVF